MSQIRQLEDDLQGLEDESHQVSEGKPLVTRIRDFTDAIARKLDHMNFQRRQALVRSVLSEVIINGTAVKALFKIPLPKVSKTSPPLAGTGDQNDGSKWTPW